MSKILNEHFSRLVAEVGESFQPAATGSGCFVFSPEQLAQFSMSLLSRLGAEAPVGVFSDVNELVPQCGQRWEQMEPESFDGMEYIHLFKAPVVSQSVFRDADKAQLETLLAEMALDLRSAGRDAHVAWERIRAGENESEAERRMREDGPKRGKDWWEGWFERSDEWLAEIGHEG